MVEPDVLAVVPVVQGDAAAPGGAAALRLLHGMPLLARAVQALHDSGVVDRIVLACPPRLRLDVEEALPVAATHASTEVVTTAGPGFTERLGELLALTPGAPSGVVLVHDAVYPLAPPALIATLVQRLTEAAPAVGAAVPVRAVTDTLKWVDGDGFVRGTAERQGFRMAYLPQAHRRDSLWQALAEPDRAGDRAGDRAAEGREAAEELPQLVRRTGAALTFVDAPAELFRISTAEDVEMAEAMLHVAVTAAERRARP